MSVINVCNDSTAEINLAVLYKFKWSIDSINVHKQFHRCFIVHIKLYYLFLLASGDRLLQMLSLFQPSSLVPCTVSVLYIVFFSECMARFTTLLLV